MGSQLNNITTDPAVKPPRIVLHGRGGSGKTTFGASIPDVLFMLAEDGLGILKVPALPVPETFHDVLEAIGELATTQDHGYRALVIDTIDHIEPLVWKQVCDDKSDSKRTYGHIEEFGYGKGYLFADPHWVRFFRGLDLLRSRGMTVVILSHNEIRNINDPMTGPYDSMQPKLHKRANALLYEWADIVGFLDIEKARIDTENKTTGRKMSTAQTLGGRLLYLEAMGGFEAKNRYGLASRIEIPKEGGYAVLRGLIADALGLTKTIASKEAA